MSTDTSEKIVDLVNEPEVQILNEGEKDFINVEIKNLQEGKSYRVEYEGDVYGIEKQDDGKIVLYEVIE
jgi:hypothetical protein